MQLLYSYIINIYINISYKIYFGVIRVRSSENLTNIHGQGLTRLLINSHFKSQVSSTSYALSMSSTCHDS